MRFFSKLEVACALAGIARRKPGYKMFTQSLLFIFASALQGPE